MPIAAWRRCPGLGYSRGPLPHHQQCRLNASAFEPRRRCRLGIITLPAAIGWLCPLLRTLLLPCHHSSSLISFPISQSVLKRKQDICPAMFLQRGSRALRSQWGASKAVGRVAMGKTPQSGVPRWFSESRRLCAIKPVLLADIGEGNPFLQSEPAPGHPRRFVVPVANKSTPPLQNRHRRM